LDVLRHGVEMLGLKKALSLAQFKLALELTLRFAGMERSSDRRWRILRDRGHTYTHNYVRRT